jgi:hypothetical protein
VPNQSGTSPYPGINKLNPQMKNLFKRRPSVPRSNKLSLLGNFSKYLESLAPS